MERSRHEVVTQLQRLGVRPGAVLLVHTSFRAVRPVEGGPSGLIAALREALGRDGTLVMPTMTSGDEVYDPRVTPTDGMGVTAETFWRQPGVLRSDHPGASFAAVGPLAEAICAPQPLEPPHGPDSPVGRVWALDGQVLLLGVDHSANTTVHLAEALARVPYRVTHPCVVVRKGVATTVDLAETDHCCQGFNRLDPLLRARRVQREGPVGNAAARLVSAEHLVQVALDALRGDPLYFLCPPPLGCGECDVARASVRAAG